MTASKNSDRRPRILVLRPEDQAAGFADLLAQRGLEPVVVPIIRVGPGDVAAIDRLISESETFAWVVFTSANGVTAVADRAEEQSRELKFERVAAIGSGTKRRLESRGIRVDWLPSKFTTRAIANELPMQSSPSVAVVRADIADTLMDKALQERGFDVFRVDAYSTEDVADERLLAELKNGVDAIAFTSASIVNAFVRIAGAHRSFRGGSNGAAVCSIGPASSDALRSAGIAIDVEAEVHSTEGLVEAIADHLAHRAQGDSLVRRAR